MSKKYVKNEGSELSESGRLSRDSSNFAIKGKFGTTVVSFKKREYGFNKIGHMASYLRQEGWKEPKKPKPSMFEELGRL
jgi:hypothetical protein